MKEKIIFKGSVDLSQPITSKPQERKKEDQNMLKYH
jgi:hypothetical protein